MALKKKSTGCFSFRKDVSTKQKHVKNKNPGRSLSSKKFLVKHFVEDWKTRRDLSGFRTWCWVVLGHFSGDNCWWFVQHSGEKIFHRLDVFQNPYRKWWDGSTSVPLNWWVSFPDFETNHQRSSCYKPPENWHGKKSTKFEDAPVESDEVRPC